MKIVSLFPAATEIVVRAGLGSSLVAVSHLCDYPPEVRRLPKITRCDLDAAADSQSIDAYVREHAASGLYHLDVQALTALAPDVIVSQSLCDVCAVSDDEVRRAIKSLGNHCEVITLSPHSLQDVLDSIVEVARLGGRELEHQAIATRAELQARVDRVAARSRHPDHKAPHVLVLEWLDPPFSAGHWTPELIALAGGCPVLTKPGARSRTLTWQEILDAPSDLVIVSACGLSVPRTTEEMERLCQAGHPVSKLIEKSAYGIWVVDGNHYFNRPGPRLVDALEWLAAVVAQPNSTVAPQISCARIPSGSHEIRVDAVLHPPTA